MAPDSRIVSIKVADAKGQTDVSQAIAAIDWVVQNRNKNGLNIRVLNMSFGTDGVQDYLLDPLAYAAEQAWHKGIVVVVAVGNEGFGTAKVNNPAYDPYLIAVGSDNANGTATTADDVVSDFSTDGDGTRNPDLVAPGDQRGRPACARVLPGPDVPGCPHRGAALPRQRHLAGRRRRLGRRGAADPAASGHHARPGQGAAHGYGSADAGATAAQQGAGLIDLAAAKDAPTPVNAKQTFERLDGYRFAGSARVVRCTSTSTAARSTGEVDVRGRAFDVRNWAPANKALNGTGMRLVAGCAGRRHELVRDDLVRHELVRHVVVRHELVRHDLVRHELDRHDLVRHELERDSVVRHELVRDVLVRHELVVRR